MTEEVSIVMYLSRILTILGVFGNFASYNGDMKCFFMSELY